MKLRANLVLLGIVAVAALSSVAAHRYLCDRRAVPLDRLSDTAFLVRELGLSPAQAEEVGRSQAVLRARLTERCARHCALRAELAADLTGNARAPALIAGMSDAYGESERLTWDHIQEVSALLTGGQRGRYHAMVARCFGGECNMESKPAAN